MSAAATEQLSPLSPKCVAILEERRLKSKVAASDRHLAVLVTAEYSYSAKAVTFHILTAVVSVLKLTSVTPGVSQLYVKLNKVWLPLHRVVTNKLSTVSQLS